MRVGIAQTRIFAEGCDCGRRLWRPHRGQKTGRKKAEFNADRSHQLSPVPAVALSKLLTRGLSMKMLRYSLAAAGMAALVFGAGSNPARASGTATQNPVRIERSTGTIVLAENKTKLKKVRLNNVILKGYDPVAYFKQGKAVMGSPFITSTYKGATYLFASREDKADFDKSPAEFEPQYGGYCAYSMSKGERHDIDPKAFHIYKGKLYVCGTPEQMKKFSASIEEDMSKADQNWLKIGPETYNTETHSFESPWPFGPEGGAQ
jgi:YHS domain-containing protein